MKQGSTTSHLPNPPRDPMAYQELYTHDWGFCFADFAGCPEIRIPPGSSTAKVYRLLPSAEDFEYGGYLTKTRIRYVACSPKEAHTDYTKPCTFHSHPTGAQYADVPSPTDIYHFLKWKHLRAITVGARWIWVWTKDHQNLKTVRRLVEWETKHMLDKLTKLSELSGDDWLHQYMKLALRRLGLRWPRKPMTDPTRWSVLLQECLGMKTSLIRRTSCR